MQRQRKVRDNMAESEAIKKLKQHFEYLKHAWKPHPDYETMDAIGYAISALEEIQQYRAIGTVEECRQAKEHRGF